MGRIPIRLALGCWGVKRSCGAGGTWHKQGLALKYHGRNGQVWDASLGGYAPGASAEIGFVP